MSSPAGQHFQGRMAAGRTKPLVTLAILALNEEENLPELFRRLTAVLDGSTFCAAIAYMETSLADA